MTGSVRTTESKARSVNSSTSWPTRGDQQYTRATTELGYSPRPSASSRDPNDAVGPALSARSRRADAERANSSCFSILRISLPILLRQARAKASYAGGGGISLSTASPSSATILVVGAANPPVATAKGRAVRFHRSPHQVSTGEE
jgi:hypothetical protein